MVYEDTEGADRRPASKCDARLKRAMVFIVIAALCSLEKALSIGAAIKYFKGFVSYNNRIYYYICLFFKAFKYHADP
jgi:hypothetical protein